MNIPIERLEIAARSLVDHPFVKQNWDKLQEAILADEYWIEYHKRYFKSTSDGPILQFFNAITHYIGLQDAGTSQILFPYMKWIFMLYIKQLILYEDIYPTIQLLLKYDKLKRTGKLPDEYKNIYDIKTSPKLHRIVEEIEKKKNLILNSEIYHWEEKGEIEIHDEFPKFKVVIPLTLDGARAMSKGTNWCTTWDEGRFNRYVSKGTLYILIINHKAAYQFYSEGDVPYFTETTDRSNEDLDRQDMFRLRNKYTMILRNAFPDKIEFGNLSSKEKFDALMKYGRLDHFLSYISPDDFTFKEWLKVLQEFPSRYGVLEKIAEQNVSNISFKEKEILWDAVVEQGFSHVYIIPIRISKQILSTEFLLYYIERVGADRAQNIGYAILFARKLGMLSLDVQKAAVDRLSQIDKIRLINMFKFGPLGRNLRLLEWIQENHPQIYREIR